MKEMSKEMRESSDYAIGTIFGKEEAEKLLKEAPRFFKNC